MGQMTQPTVSSTEGQ